jgi:AcrR family transcriptional regulator
MVRKPSLERRAEFLRAALKLFVANGVQHTSTAAIAREAGSAAGTLFIYFPTKQDLIHELTLKIGREQSEYIHSLLAPSLSVQETFRAIWDGSTRWFLEHREAYNYIQQVRHSNLLDEAIVRESEKFFDYYYLAIQRGLEEEVIKPYPIELVGGLIYQDVVAVMDLIGAQPDPEVQEQYIRWGFEIFWDGIKTL